MNNFIFSQDWCHATQLLFSQAIHLAIFKTVPTQSLIQSPVFNAIHQDSSEVNMSKLETSSHSSSAHYISRECAFFLSTADSKTAHQQDPMLLNSHVGPWTPTCSPQLLNNELILPLLLAQLSRKGTQFNKGKQRCEFTAQTTFYSHSWTYRKAGERKCLVGAQQSEPLSHSCSSAMLGEGKDTGVSLMFYKAHVGNSKCPCEVLPASLCTWDPAT